jgi:hypothetical protein
MELTIVVFSDARPAGDHQHPGGECDADGLLLALGKRQLRPPLHPGDLRPHGSAQAGGSRAFPIYAACDAPGLNAVIGGLKPEA